MFLWNDLACKSSERFWTEINLLDRSHTSSFFQTFFHQIEWYDISGRYEGLKRGKNLTKNRNEIGMINAKTKK